MPELRSPQDIIAESRAQREAVKAAKTARGMNDSDATLRARASAALDRVNRITETVRSDYHDPKAARDRASGGADPLDNRRIEAMERELAEQSRELRVISQTLAVRRAASEEFSDERSRKPEYQAYRKALAGWIRGRLNDTAMEAAKHTAIQARAITESDADGGFLVPFEIEKRIERVLETICAVRGIAMVRGMTTAVYKKPFNVGGSSGGWVTEQQSRPETNTAKLIMLEFPAFEYYAYPFASQTMFEDADFDVEAWLADEVAIVAAENEGNAFINGDGVMQPRGFLTYPIVANTGYPTKDTFTPSTFQQIGYVPTGVAAALTDSTHNGEDCLIDLVHGLRPGYRPGGAFLMNDLTLSQVRKFKDQYGQYLLAQPLGSADEPERLLGKPVHIDENMPSVAANAYPIAFADWERSYLVLDRVGMRVLRDPFTNKPFIGFYNTRRVGGGVQNFESIKLLKVATS